MAQELAYVIFTPYTLSKSRTGGILARLITRSGMELVSARMFAPSRELVNEYAAGIVTAGAGVEPRSQELIREYVRTHFAPDPRTGRRRRAMVLLFQGEDAVRRIRAVVGSIRFDRTPSGETIRDTYGDLVLDDNGNLQYFEPAILCAPNFPEAKAKCQIWAKYSNTDGGLLENVIFYQPGETPQRTLVLLKPDNFQFPSGRPGNMIDFFSRSGLYIVAIKLHRMSVAQAVEFYGPVKETLKTKLGEMVGSRAARSVEREFGFIVPPDKATEVGNVLCPLFGEFQFDNIVRFMSGKAPHECSRSEWNEPGSQRCIAVVYEGPDAVRKIRDILGPTDPSKAPPGSIRREVGQDVMVNAAHASDSPENAQREIRIVNTSENNFQKLIEEFYGK